MSHVASINLKEKKKKKHRKFTHQHGYDALVLLFHHVANDLVVEELDGLPLNAFVAILFLQVTEFAFSVSLQQ